MIFYLFEIATTYIENYILYSSLCTFFQIKNKVATKHILIVLSTLFVLYLNSYSFFSFVTLLCVPLFWCILSTFFFKIPLVHTMSFGMFFILILLTFDSIVLTVMALITQNPNFTEVLLAGGIQRIIFISIDKALFLSLYLIVKKYIQSLHVFDRNKYLPFIIIAGLCEAVYLTFQTIRHINLDLTLSWIFFLAVIVLLLLVIYFHAQRKHEKDILKFVEMRNALLESNYNNLKASFETNSKMFHDFKNHIQVISELLNKDKIDSLKEYIAGFDLSEINKNSMQWTEDTVVNFILETKMDSARLKGIRVSANIDFPIHTDILPNDITIILANLFDNAMESCDRSVSITDKKINIVIRRINQILIIKFENSCDERPKIRNKHLVSSKSDKNLHGWGMKSIESTVKKYDGAVNWDYDEDSHIFRTTLNLSFHEIDTRKI